MSQAKDRELLRRLELISRIKPSAESTDRAMTKARQALLDAKNAPASQPSQPRIIRLLHLNTGVKTAIAAMIIIALSVGIALWKNLASPNSISPYARDGHTEVPLPTEISPTDRLQYESDQINEMVARKDTQGLVDLMQTALPTNRLFIADHLQEWGDESAIPVLQRFAKQWTGQTGSNPYAQAITAIEQRLAQNDSGSETPSKIDSVSTSDALVTTETMTSQTANIELKGYVTDKQTGKPIADANISIVGPSTYETQTDSKGFYHVDTISDSGPYQIKVTAQGYLGLDTPSTMGFVSLAQDSQTVKDFQLEKGCLIHVLVVDEAGQSIPNAKLSVSWLGVDRDNDVGRPITTDTEGEATTGPVKISDIAYSICAIHDGFAPQYATAQCISPDVSPSVLIVLPKGQTVQGYAAYSDGVPANGVEIIARPDWWHNINLPPGYPVDANGNFSLTSVEPNSYSLFARFSQPDGSMNETEVAQVELPPVDDELLSVTLPRTSPQPTVSISGTLLWADETRPDFVDIFAYSPDMNTESTIRRIQLTNDLNQFNINGLAPGQYNLYFEGRNVQPVLLQNIAAPLSDLEVALTYIPTPVLSGTVVRADTGEGINDFILTLLKKRSLPGSLYLSDRQRNRIVDANGQFEFPLQQLGPGTYDIQIDAEGYVPVTIEHTITGDDKPLYIELSEGGGLMGHVVDLQGQPITGAVVLVTSAHSVNPMTVKTRTQNGDFRLEHLAEGPQVVSITHPDYGSIMIDDIDVTEGFMLDLGHITLFSGATIEGVILDHLGLPVPNAALTFEDGSGQVLTSATTNEVGFYKTMGLPTGQYLISLNHPDPNIGLQQHSLSIEQDKSYFLDLPVYPRAIFSLRVVGENEQPLMSAMAWLEDTESINRYKPLFRTDTDFVFIADAGNYTLHVEREGYRPATQTITIDPNDKIEFNSERPVINIQLQPN